MTIYKINFYISKGEPKETKIIIRDNWIEGRDYSIIFKRELPDSSIRTKDVSVIIDKRICKYDYLPWPKELSRIGQADDNISCSKEIKWEELPTELLNVCRAYMFKIDKFINEPFYICGKCRYNNKYSKGPCGRCSGEVLPSWRN